MFFVSAWYLAVIYIDLDSETMLTEDYYGGINVDIHAAGGLQDICMVIYG